MEERRNTNEPRAYLKQFVEELRHSPIAIAAESANEQHYEVPTEFFKLVLGPHLKYSSCYWPAPETALVQAEEDMLDLFCRHAGIEDGMDILELGCGWGSLCLWIAHRYPQCRIYAISNSQTQREYIQSCCNRLELCNKELLQIFQANGNHMEAARELQRWRIFFMACAELFKYRKGREWYVSHCLFRNIQRCALPKPRRTLDSSA
jgi:cyclopropane-fatty-acyl-phospholipid synthase